MAGTPLENLNDLLTEAQTIIDGLDAGSFASVNYVDNNFGKKNGTLQTNLNADLLDSQHGSYYATASGLSTANGNISTNTSAIATINSTAAFRDGTLQTNLDADKLDGQHGSYYASVASVAALPVKDGTLQTNLNADMLDSQHGSYYATASGLSTANSNISTNTTNIATINSTAAFRDGTLQTNLDADKLDGQHGAYYATASSVAALPVKDGTLQSNLNADMLDGNHASYFATASGLSTANGNIATNTSNIATNTSNIATLTTDKANKTEVMLATTAAATYNVAMSQLQATINGLPKLIRHEITINVTATTTTSTIYIQDFTIVSSGALMIVGPTTGTASFGALGIQYCNFGGLLSISRFTATNTTARKFDIYQCTGQISFFQCVTTAGTATTSGNIGYNVEGADASLFVNIDGATISNKNIAVLCSRGLVRIVASTGTGNQTAYSAVNGRIHFANAYVDTGVAGTNQFSTNTTESIFFGTRMIRNESLFFPTGTWTPAWQGATTAGVFAYQRQNGQYIRIGRMCFITASVILNSISTAPAGTLRLTGLPYAQASTHFAIFTLGNIANWTTNPSSGYIDSAIAYIQFKVIGSTAAMAATALGGTAQLYVMGGYFVAAA